MPLSGTTTLQEYHYPLKHPRYPEKSLKILFWNVWYGSNPNKIIEAITSFDCDALFLFEVDGNKQVPESLCELGYGGMFLETNHFGLFKEVRGGIAFFSRLRTNYIRPTTLVRGRRGLWRGGSDSRRCYLEASLSLPGSRPLILGGTHLSYKLPFIGGQNYQHEISTLRREIEKHRSHFIFGGDLNATLDSPLLDALNSSFAYQGPDTKITSWPVRRIIQYLLPHKLFDHAVSTHDLEILSAHFADNRSSDHLPLIIEVRIPLDN